MGDVKKKALYILEKALGLTVGLDEKLDIDSLERVELIMWLEEDFGISIPDEDVEKLDTANKIIEYVKSK